MLSALLQPSFLVVTGEQLRRSCPNVGKPLREDLGDARVKLLPLAPQQGAISGVLHQRMLERINRRRRGSSRKHQLCSRELSEGIPEFVVT